jgi:hypothetical protein
MEWKQKAIYPTPTDGKTVIFCNPYYGEETMDIGYYNQSLQKWILNGGGLISHFTHWRKAPTMPKVNDEPL